MKNYDKYKPGYFPPPEECLDWVKKDHIEKAPMWCSVDLRDGNQALIVPMSLEEKLEFFQFLVKLGFKEIEVGFPAASETEYEFLRRLIDDNLIPEDVTVQVLTQSRRHIIKKTFEALEGVKKAVVHLYNSTSVAQREQVFKASKEEITEIATSGAKLIKKYAAKYPDTEFNFEYSPESFTGTEMEFARDICNAVIDIWEPTPQQKVIINLPATVSMSMPHIYASQIEYMSKHLHNRENVIISLHPHNDRGTGVADAELGILAGAIVLLLCLGKFMKKKIRIGKVNITPVLVFIGIMVIATAIELIASYIMEWTTGDWMWDYDRFWMNFEGRIAPNPSFRFGIGGMVMLYIFYPLFRKIIDKRKDRNVAIVAAITAVIFLLDCIFHNQI